MTTMLDLPPASAASAGPAASALPAAGTWRVDSTRSEVAFVGRYVLRRTIRGRFSDVQGQVVIAADPAESSVDVAIGVGSFDFGGGMWNDLVRAGDLFAARTHPTARYRSRAVHWDGEGARVDGDLTLRGVTRSVPLVVSLDSPDAARAYGHATFSARARIDRSEFGLEFPLPALGGGALLSRDVGIEITLAALLDA